MKKLIYPVFVLLSASILFSACQEDTNTSSIVFLDENNQRIDALEFSYTDSIRSFKIRNNGKSSFNWVLTRVNSEQWFNISSPIGGQLAAGGEQAFTVTINREHIQVGVNNTMVLRLNNQNDALDRKEFPVTAVGTAPPTFTSAVGVINTTSARLRGEITDAGFPAYTERGFVFSTAENPTLTNGTRIVVANSAENRFSTDITALTPEQTYHVRAYAISALGTFYSENATFKPSDRYDYITIFTEHSGSLTAHAYDIGGLHNWQTARDLCRNSAVGGYDDWRLPTRDELLFLYQRKYDFGNFAQGGIYWSGTFWEFTTSGRYWARHFGNYGETASASRGAGIFLQTEVHRVRCVRPVN